VPEDRAVVELSVRRLDPDLPLPTRQHGDDAGYDLVAREDARLAPAGGRAIIPTGIAVAIPPGYAGFVQPRSGLAFRHGVTVLNSPGLVDAGYRDELRVILVNLDPVEEFTVRRGDRIAQLVIQRVEAPELRVVDALDDTDRGFGGFGSTGV
jgi:dUTP pyrophosphatase